MTINIASMNAVFSNANVKYTGIGVFVTDNASLPNSNLLNFTVNNSPKFGVTKYGVTRISTSLPEASNTRILQINNDCKDLVIAIPNRVTIKTLTTQSRNVAYTKTYSEGHLTVFANSGVANIDVSKSSVFHLKSPTNTITSLTIYTPTEISSNGNVSYSFSMLVSDMVTFANSVWDQANVVWTNLEGYPPRVGSGNVSVYTFFAVRGYGQSVNNRVWFGVHSNRYLTIDTRRPPAQYILKYSVDSTEVTVDSTLITVDSL